VLLEENSRARAILAVVELIEHLVANKKYHAGTKREDNN
jgi:hypothetical protein